MLREKDAKTSSVPVGFWILDFDMADVNTFQVSATDALRAAMKEAADPDGLHVGI